jgi:hypothetical protein
MKSLQVPTKMAQILMLKAAAYGGGVVGSAAAELHRSAGNSSARAYRRTLPQAMCPARSSIPFGG